MQNVGFLMTWLISTAILTLPLKKSSRQLIVKVKECMLSTGKLPQGGLPRNSVVRIDDHPNVTSAVYSGHKAINQTNHLQIIMSPPCKGHHPPAWVGRHIVFPLASVCGSVCLCVCFSGTKSCPPYNLITVTDILTKLHTFVKHIETTCHAQEP